MAYQLERASTAILPVISTSENSRLKAVLTKNYIYNYGFYGSNISSIIISKQ